MKVIINYNSTEFQTNHDQNYLNDDDDDFSENSSETSDDFLVDQGTSLSININLNVMDKLFQDAETYTSPQSVSMAILTKGNCKDCPNGFNCIQRISPNHQEMNFQQSVPVVKACRSLLIRHTYGEQMNILKAVIRGLFYNFLKLIF